MARPVVCAEDAASADCCSAGASSESTASSARKSPQKKNGRQASSRPRPLSRSETLARLRKVCSDAMGDESWEGQSAETLTLPSHLRLVSPLEVYFSQSHIRPTFQDGRSIEEALESIEAELLSALPDEGAALEVPQESADGWWLLCPAFPEIEVINWRCKLRGEDGATTTDSSGQELYGPLGLYTLDNRRLYCLQKVAAKLHPVEVRVLVSVVRQEDGNCREFRKFRTPDLGRSVGIGHRDSTTLPRWSWRQEAGLPEEPPPQGAPLPQRHARGRRKLGPNSGDRRGRRYSEEQDDEEEEEGRSQLENVFICILLYMILRIVFQLGKRMLDSGLGSISGSASKG
eukprot:TRINITY_DN13662_c0_g2_i1.p1 TRINITY_DN13662_c0_g2~~TRINITY_DN13662_c0_g2_i1.p1  ORF type:complete len:345 (-),score=60.85 TRINITY_DN13662_c0_g2_i1:258-1292(-)